MDSRVPLMMSWKVPVGQRTCLPGPIMGTAQGHLSSLAGLGTHQGWTARTFRMKRAALCETLGYSLKASKRPARIRFSVSMGSSSKNGDRPLSLKGWRGWHGLGDTSGRAPGNPTHPWLPRVSIPTSSWEGSAGLQHPPAYNQPGVSRGTKAWVELTTLQDARPPPAPSLT